MLQACQYPELFLFFMVYNYILETFLLILVNSKSCRPQQRFFFFCLIISEVHPSVRQKQTFLQKTNKGHLRQGNCQWALFCILSKVFITKLNTKKVRDSEIVIHVFSNVGMDIKESRGQLFEREETCANAKLCVYATEGQNNEQRCYIHIELRLSNRKTKWNVNTSHFSHVTEA